MIPGEAARVYLTFAWPGLFAAPLLRRAFPRLPDGGLSIARPLGWLIIAWISWIIPSLGIPAYGNGLVFFASALLVASGAFVAGRDRAEWRAIFGRSRGTILLGEAIGLALFVTFVWMVQWNGDVHPAAERFMDYAILERLSLTRTFPPLDAWMAGKTLQYYYYGYVVMDVLRRLSGVEMRWFFNLAIPGVFSAFAVALFGGGLSLVGTRRAAIAAVAGGALFGNFDFARQIVYHRWRDGRWSFFPVDWFHTSRVINGTINEVPAFSVFWGDLHPYFIAFPFVALVCTLAIASVLDDPPPLSPKRSLFDRLLTLFVLAIPLGALFPTNSWDAPTFTTVLMAALAWPLLPPMNDLLGLGTKAAWLVPGVSWKTSIRDRVVKEWKTWVQDVALVCGAVGIVAVVLYLPFNLTFGGQAKRGFGLAQRRSDALALMTHFGPWLLVIEGWAIATSRTRAERIRRALPLPLTALALAIYELFVEKSVTGWVTALAAHGGVLAIISQGADHLLLRGLAFVLVIAALWVLLADLDWEEVRTSEGISRVLTCAALGLVLICEFAFVRDFYGGDNERMNTVFKAYIQAWILFGLGGAGLFSAIWRALKKRTFAWKASFALATLLIVAACGSFNFLADYTRSNRFTSTRSAPRPTWDAEDLFRKTYRADAEAVDWIRANLPPDATILETTAHAYEWPSRISTFTGRCSLVGWKNHESGWRNSWDLALERGGVIQKVYETPDLATAVELLQKYDIDYVYVGELERNRLAKDTKDYQLEKFQALPQVMSWQNGRAILYRVPKA